LLSKSQNSLLSSIVELLQSVVLLLIQTVSCVSEFNSFPLIASINLIQGDDEGTFLLAQKLNRLKSLGFQTMHQIDNQDSNVT
jgi:hypothetical protein